MKVGEKRAEQSTFEKSRASKENIMEIDYSKENDDNVFDMDTDGNYVQIVFEEEMEKNNVPTTVHVEKVQGGDNEFSDKVECDNENVMKKVYGDTKIIHVEVGDIIVSAVLAKTPRGQQHNLPISIIETPEILISKFSCPRI
ncbi:hypothetical protein LWI28_019663 [Acer negundo]|uniref:Uncharacterized protein n=1 Tax=Acer negundo TaxID=4023 RepID=A0AAD5IV13_ACENE|nr:hypothetical protein LWI28_019663 [Acer negundo]